jgi:hypothetical protein
MKNTIAEDRQEKISMADEAHEGICLLASLIAKKHLATVNRDQTQKAGDQNEKKSQ